MSTSLLYYTTVVSTTERTPSNAKPYHLLVVIYPELEHYFPFYDIVLARNRRLSDHLTRGDIARKWHVYTIC